MATPKEWAERVEALLKEVEADGCTVAYSPQQSCTCCPPDMIDLEIYRGNDLQTVRVVYY